MTIESILRIIFQMNYKNTIDTPARPRAFTLIELLIVIAIIAILVALVTVAAGMMLQQAKSTKDLGNHRAIGMATFSHATDHSGKLLHPGTYSNDDSENLDPDTINRFWIAGPGSPEEIELKSALEEGAAYQYIGDVMAFQSPLDPTIGDVTQFVVTNPSPVGRIRSYSLNAFVGVQMGADENSIEYEDDLSAQGYWRSTETISQVPQPANTMCSIGEEEKNGQNRNGWMISPTSKLWIDFPAFWDNRRINISYVDGSTGAIMLESDTLKQAWLDDDDGHDVDLPDNDVEYKKFRRVLLPGVIGSVLD